MLTKEEFLALYQKYQAGKCTPEEIELLNSYRDDMQMAESNWQNNDEDEQEVRNRIWQKLNQSRGVNRSSKKTKRYAWLKVAAVLLAVLSAGILALKIYSNSEKLKPLAIAANHTKKISVPPGGNKAFLTMADGSVIALNDAKNGQLATQEGVKVSKAKDGMLVYHFDNDNEAAGIANTINAITTPRSGQYQIVLADGTKVWLNAVSTLRFPVAFNGKDRKVELIGEGYFEVSKNKDKPFIVNANGTNVRVLGTHFNISAYADDKAVTTTLLEGAVRLEKGGNTAMLTPGQQGISENGMPDIKVKSADTELAMAWKNGFFLFKDTYITDIMKQASRWYDVDIAYQDNLKNKEYGGKISKYSDISELLHNLELTGTIHFKVEGRRITVMQ